MSRIQTVNRSAASAQVNATLDGIKGKIGFLPNVFATFANTPAVLNAYLAYSDALNRGRLTPAQREALALAIAQANQCDYCLSAHTKFANLAGISAGGIQGARQGNSDDALTDAILKLAVKIVTQRGGLSDADLEEARRNGVDDALVIEVIGNVALHTLTNYTNRIAATDIDFPVVHL